MPARGPTGPQSTGTPSRRVRPARSRSSTAGSRAQFRPPGDRSETRAAVEIERRREIWSRIGGAGVWNGQPGRARGGGPTHHRPSTAPGFIRPAAPPRGPSGPGGGVRAEERQLQLPILNLSGISRKLELSAARSPFVGPAPIARLVSDARGRQKAGQRPPFARAAARLNHSQSWPTARWSNPVAPAGSGAPASGPARSPSVPGGSGRGGRRRLGHLSQVTHRFAGEHAGLGSDTSAASGSPAAVLAACPQSPPPANRHAGRRRPPSRAVRATPARRSRSGRGRRGWGAHYARAWRHPRAKGMRLSTLPGGARAQPPFFFRRSAFRWFGRLRGSYPWDTRGFVVERAVRAPPILPESSVQAPPSRSRRRKVPLPPDDGTPWPNPVCGRSPFPARDPIQAFSQHQPAAGAGQRAGRGIYRAFYFGPWPAGLVFSSWFIPWPFRAAAPGSAAVVALPTLGAAGGGSRADPLRLPVSWSPAINQPNPTRRRLAEGAGRSPGVSAAGSPGSRATR